jgi:serine/threonine protein kinase
MTTMDEPDFFSDDPEASFHPHQPMTPSSLLSKLVEIPGVKFIPCDKLSKENYLAHGAFGAVSRAKLGKIDVAVKRPHDPLDIETEVRILTQISADCHHIVGFYGVTIDKVDRLGIVMEYCAQGTLRHYLKKEFKHIQWQDKLILANEIATGLNFIHRGGYLHRDLHSKNILIDETGRAMITDFGLSRDIDRTQSTHAVHGIAPYIPPERLKKPPERYTQESDIYSLGVVFWEISSGTVPFATIEPRGIYLEVVNGKREIPIVGTPSLYEQLYTQCWDSNPNHRPSLDHVLVTLGTLMEDQGG